mmetsp:Transcript_20954/g.34939  ORF Transcript_20954/g.34939 Transcript_20954/m.34939 type:complete len:85 (-) Transcript_20954:76-330(-)
MVFVGCDRNRFWRRFPCQRRELCPLPKVSLVWKNHDKCYSLWSVSHQTYLRELGSESATAKRYHRGLGFADHEPPRAPPSKVSA